MRADSEQQSPLHSNREGWGRVLQLDPAGVKSTNTVDGVLMETGVAHCQPYDGASSCFLTIEQTRSMVQFNTTVWVPPWGVAYELPAGYARLSIRANGPVTVPIKFGVGISRGLALRHWLGSPNGTILVPANSVAGVDPLPYSRRVTIAVMDGTLLTPSGPVWLASGQSQTIDAQTVKLATPLATPATVSITWEVVA